MNKSYFIFFSFNISLQDKYNLKNNNKIFVFISYKSRNGPTKPTFLAHFVAFTPNQLST